MGETIGSDLAISDGGSAAGAARRTGNGAHWVTGILSAMAGATVAIIVTDFRLQNVLGQPAAGVGGGLRAVCERGGAGCSS